jgi:hypothetical protein
MSLAHSPTRVAVHVERRGEKPFRFPEKKILRNVDLEVQSGGKFSPARNEIVVKYLLIVDFLTVNRIK